MLLALFNFTRKDNIKFKTFILRVFIYSLNNSIKV